METELSSAFSSISIPIFDGTNYHMWAVKMEAYLNANDLWEAVENVYEVPELTANPTMAQLKAHKEKKLRKSKSRSILFTAVSSVIFNRIMTLKTAHEIWKYLKEEYEGSERIKGMQVLNLVREFEIQKMKEADSIKDYVDKLLGIANKVRLLGGEFSDSRIVQKILVTITERFEATIISLENSRDLSSITLAELLNALQAQEQRRLMREKGTVEGAFQAKLVGENHKVCSHCKKINHPQYKCWWRPDIKCRRCGDVGHIEKVCKKQIEAKVAIKNQEDEELF